MAGAKEKQSHGSVGNISLAEARQRNTERLGEDIKRIDTKASATCETLKQNDMQRMADAEAAAKAYIDQYAGPVSKSLSTSHALLLKCLSENEAHMRKQAKGMDPEGTARRASDLASLYKQKGAELEQKVAQEMSQHRAKAASIRAEMQRRINVTGKIQAFEQVLKTDV